MVDTRPDRDPWARGVRAAPLALGLAVTAPGCGAFGICPSDPCPNVPACWTPLTTRLEYVSERYDFEDLPGDTATLTITFGPEGEGWSRTADLGLSRTDGFWTFDGLERYDTMITLGYPPDLRCGRPPDLAFLLELPPYDPFRVIGRHGTVNRTCPWSDDDCFTLTTR